MNNSKPLNPPAMSELLDQHRRGTQLEINCHQIGIIKSFDASLQVADIQIAYKQVVSIDPNGKKTFEEYPLLLECPVVVLYGGNSFLSMPVQPGDDCLVFFNDRDIDRWLNEGAGSYPNSPRLHDLSDAIAIVGLRPYSKSLANYLADGIRLSFSPTSQIDFKESLMESIAAMFIHNGDMLVNGNLRISGNLTIDGETYGNAGDEWVLQSTLRQLPGNSIHAGDGANGTFTVVTVVDGIVTGGSS